jgi:osmotically inducible protein OsmC
MIARRHDRSSNKVLADSVELPYQLLILQTLSEAEARATIHSVNRKASAVWKGGLRDGTGTMSTESGVLNDTQYSFREGFDKGIGTNPEELIAASFSGCFSMALSHELGLLGLHPGRIETTAVATLEELKAGWTLTRIHLDVRATVPNATQNHFIDAALAAQTKCPGWRLLKPNISMTATLDPIKANRLAEQAPGKRAPVRNR